MDTNYAALMPHGPIEPLFDDVWTVVGTVDMGPLLRITRTMCVLGDGDALTLVNAVRLSPEGEAALAKLGVVKHVVRLGLHGMDDAWYVDHHGAELWALPGVQHARGKQTSQELSRDHLPMDDLQLFRFEQTVDPEAALLLTRHGGLLMTCDSVQNWTTTAGCSLAAKAVTRAMGFMKPAQIGPPWRKRMTPPGGSLRSDFERLAALDFKHLVGGHGTPLVDEANVKLHETIDRVFGPG